jgi:L-amino acid N-acyltransferase YncA
VSAYVHAAHRGQGVGTLLYEALIERLRARGFVSAYAGIALPNDASVRLHESLGFEPVGVYRNVGYKLGAWRDVGWWQLSLREPPDAPAPPR